MLLNTQGVAARVEVLNLGVWGYNAAQEADLFEARVAALSPDLVLVGVFPSQRARRPEAHRGNLRLASSQARGRRDAPSFRAYLVRGTFGHGKSRQGHKESRCVAVDVTGTQGRRSNADIAGLGDVGATR